ncbi:MAG: hybrid sensor histidine kinase/response regulator [Coleofasciculaceae cyanobacterium SM2_1_6]|nr:hybrid sensor histidine kinase/response regulator [Coleofasciculaceae cyanobacterium SM2_1_6]
MAANVVTGLILIVDDIPSNLDVISDALSDMGFDVAIATNGERALQQAERKPPDLILLDVMMPGIDGFETCRRLKANSNTADIPVIFMTALSDINSKVQALDLGAVDYVTKPFQEQEVLARVKTHLQLRHLTQTLEQQVAEKTAELQASQMQLIQSEKMSALGQLVAGVAHEINNPVGFIGGNLFHADGFIKDLINLIDIYQTHYPEPVPEVKEELETIDFEYLRTDLPNLVKSMKSGLDRIQDISKSLRIFSRSDSISKVTFNIHDGIDSAILILKYRLKANDMRPEIQIIKNYGEVPLIECFPGQLNQVFMNIMVNAIDMFDEMAENNPSEDLQANPQQIMIDTSLVNKQLHICIADNGSGMQAEIKARIFNYLFTTKGVGKGTGLGLAIARQIVVEKHGGTIEVDSIVGTGTKFIITLPA